MKNNNTQVLKESTIEIEDYNSFISKKGVVVKIEITGGRNSYFITPKIYGVKNERLTEGSREFLGQHMNNGRVQLIPRELGNQLRSKESMLKKRLSEIAIGYNNSFVPIESFKEYEEFFEKVKDEYMEIRDNLVANFPDIVERFITIARDTMIDLDAEDAEAEISEIISKLPNVNDFHDSFRVNMTVSAFPNAANIDMFDESIRDKILGSVKQADEDMIRSSFVSSIDEGISALSSVLNSDVNRPTLHPKVQLKINNSIKSMKEKNIFANERIEEYASSIHSILSLKIEEAIGKAEEIISSLYFYSTELGVEEDVNLKDCPLSREMLLDLNEMYK